jgi:UDP-N-acetylglucosamine acyltransferase
MSNISPLAIIEDGAQIGENVTIAPHVFISSQSIIGDGTVIDHGACIYGKTTIGKNNHIFAHAVLGSIPQDLKFKGEEVELIIGDNNSIREFTLFNPGTEGGGSKTIIGDNNLFMGYVHLGHDAIVGSNCVLANGVALAGHAEIGDHVVIGAYTPVHQFCHIGDHVMIGGASALAQDIPPYCLAEGNRAKLRGLNLNGLRRRMERSDINALKSAYAALFNKGRPLKEVAQELLDSSDNEHVIKLCNFVMETKRGIPFEREEA